MIPAARMQAAIELLDLIIAAAREEGPPADRLIAQWFRVRRYAGSKDRRAVRELVYRAIRACGPIPEHGRAAMLRLCECDPGLLELFDGSRHGPAPLSPGETAARGGVAPDWLAEALVASGIEAKEAEALLGRAPLDIRVNRIKAGGLNLPITGEATVARDGMRFPPGTPVEQWDAWSDGAIEIQDTASQLVAEAVAAAPGEQIVDLCAGAGGKALALAAEMENAGTLLCCDIDRQRLARLAPRAARAGASPVVQIRLLDPGREFDALAEWENRADAVLVDAPCSGTGTWRRNPEARWRLNESRLQRLHETQAYLLELAARLVRPGGRIVYAVCSLLDSEGPDQLSMFLAERPDWRAEQIELGAGRPCGQGIRLSPFHDGTDGFFVARLARPC